MGRRPHPARVGRSEIANHAARLLVDGGVVDFDSARRKALRELGAEQGRDLPDNLESVLALHLTGHSYAQIAETLGISERNVSVRLSRARARLRRQLVAA